MSRKTNILKVLKGGKWEITYDFREHSRDITSQDIFFQNDNIKGALHMVPPKIYQNRLAHHLTPFLFTNESVTSKKRELMETAGEHLVIFEVNRI